MNKQGAKQNSFFFLKTVHEGNMMHINGVFICEDDNTGIRSMLFQIVL
jgi:hypothetical protein